MTRRDLFHVLPTGAAACLGCTGMALCAAQTAAQTGAPEPSSGFGAKADMTWEQVFRFAHLGYAQILKKLSAEIGHDRFDKMLREAASEEVARSVTALTKSVPERNIAAFALYMKTQPIYRSALVWNVVEESPTAFEIHVSQCLWAKTFRAQDAAEIGYARICYPDYAASEAFNPKMKMIRTKTLMQGHDCCNHRWAMEI